MDFARNCEGTEQLQLKNNSQKETFMLEYRVENKNVYPRISRERGRFSWGMKSDYSGQP
jgi:hypothetical protein